MWIADLIERMASARSRAVFHIDLSSHGMRLRCSDSDIGTTDFAWDRVDEIRCYKVDCFAYDEICISFLVGNKRVECSEGMIGFSDLIHEIGAHFKGMPCDWYNTVMLPPFETNERVLWRRES